MEAENIREIVQGVVRACRDSHPAVQRPFMNEMACFFVQATFLQHPGLCCSFKDGVQNNILIGRCVNLLTLEDCPAIETIQLQISAQGLIFVEHVILEEEKRQHEQRLDKIIQNIISIKVEDTRELPRVADNLHRLVSEFVMETSKGMDKSLNSSFLIKMAEMHAALNSVFPKTDFIYWIDLQDAEKVSQLRELSNIIPGICAYNRAIGESSRNCQLPFDIFEEGSRILEKRVKDELDDVRKRIHGYREAISLHIDSLGVEHVLIQRLRDEMIYEIQLSSFLQALEFDLNEMNIRVRRLSDSFFEHLKLLCTTIGTQKCVPNELVYPDFHAVGLSQRKASEDIRNLQVLSKTATALHLLSREPSFRRTPVGLAGQSTHSKLMKLRIMANNCEFLPAYIYTTNCAETDMLGHVDQNNNNTPKITIVEVDGVQEALAEGLEMQLKGYCTMNIIRNRGILIPGDPKAGLVQVGWKIFAFSTSHALAEFMKAPHDALTDLEMVITTLPHIVNLLGCQHDPRFSNLEIAKILQIVNRQPLSSDFSTQTGIHIQPQHQFDKETLFKRALQLANKQTHSMQTLSGHSHRDSSAQVWNPKDKSTQRLLGKGTTMPKRVKYFENLRGPPDCKFSAVDIMLDV